MLEKIGNDVFSEIKNKLRGSEVDEIKFLWKHFQGELTRCFCHGMSMLKIKKLNLIEPYLGIQFNCIQYNQKLKHGK